MQSNCFFQWPQIQSQSQMLYCASVRAANHCPGILFPKHGCSLAAFLFVVCTHCLCLIVLAPSLLSLLRIPLSELHSLPVGASTQFLSQMYLFQLWVETREHFLLPLQINECKSCSFFPAVSFGCRFLCIADGVQVPSINANVPLFTCLPSLTSQIDLHCFT